MATIMRIFGIARNPSPEFAPKATQAARRRQDWGNLPGMLPFCACLYLALPKSEKKGM